MSKIHELKLLPDMYQATVERLKTFEWRKNDRDFQVGDCLRLKEYCPQKERYTGREIVVVVTYILWGGQLDIPEDYIVMSTEKRGRA